MGIVRPVDSGYKVAVSAVDGIGDSLVRRVVRRAWQLSCTSAARAWFRVVQDERLPRARGARSSLARCGRGGGPVAWVRRGMVIRAWPQRGQ